MLTNWVSPKDLLDWPSHHPMHYHSTVTKLLLSAISSSLPCMYVQPSSVSLSQEIPDTLIRQFYYHLDHHFLLRTQSPHVALLTCCTQYPHVALKDSTCCTQSPHVALLTTCCTPHMLHPHVTLHSHVALIRPSVLFLNHFLLHFFVCWIFCVILCTYVCLVCLVCALPSLLPFSLCLYLFFPSPIFGIITFGGFSSVPAFPQTLQIVLFYKQHGVRIKPSSLPSLALASLGVWFKHRTLKLLFKRNCLSEIRHCLN